jgi:hypothetical protein
MGRIEGTGYLSGRAFSMVCCWDRGWRVGCFDTVTFAMNFPSGRADTIVNLTTQGLLAFRFSEWSR